MRYIRQLEPIASMTNDETRRRGRTTIQRYTDDDITSAKKPDPPTSTGQ
jgi:hypothetical protein